MSEIPVYPLSSLKSGLPLEVKGAYYHRHVLGAMFQLENARDNEEFFVDVTLVPEPDNPHSRSGDAVSVRWRDHVIGYLPSGEGTKFAQLRRVAASGYDATTKARVWTNKNWEGKRDFWVRVSLPVPELLLPLNNPPADGYVVLPEGSAVQVTKESDHIDHLADFVPPSGYGQVLVTLHLFQAGKTKHWDGVEVRLEGERVGELSRVSSEKFAPTVRHFEENGLTVVARATIKGSSIAAELVLFAAKAHELDEELLETEETNSLPRLVDFEEDPRAYKVVNRFQPGDSDEARREDYEPVAEPASGDSRIRLNEEKGRIEIDASYFTDEDSPGHALYAGSQTAGDEERDADPAKKKSGCSSWLGCGVGLLLVFILMGMCGSGDEEPSNGSNETAMTTTQ